MDDEKKTQRMLDKAATRGARSRGRARADDARPADKRTSKRPFKPAVRDEAALLERFRASGKGKKQRGA